MKEGIESEITEDIENIEEGIYFVVASDSNGCSITIDISITEPQEIIINYYRNFYKKLIYTYKFFNKNFTVLFEQNFPTHL